LKSKDLLENPAPNASDSFGHWILDERPVLMILQIPIRLLVILPLQRDLITPNPGKK
jgi:hypothetical protein